MSEDVNTGTWTETREASGEVAHIRTCRLDVASGPDAGLSRTVGAQAIRIGRTGTDLVLTDKKISGVHCEIRLEDGGYRIRDLGSTNGTWLRGVRIVEAFIEPGTTFAIGDTTVTFAPQQGSVEVPLWSDSSFGGMVGKSVGMRKIFAAIDRVAATDATVLVSGESGTGKELIAEAVHDRSPRVNGPFIVLDCGAVPPQLFEAQLFGHEKGAFTDAVRATPGSFELADGGTLFLDEIGELPLDMQSKLLRAVETRRIRRIGGSDMIDCDVRIVAATNRDLAVEMNRGAFRSDLYYRLAVVEIHVPPLRDRMDDLDVLVDALAGDRRDKLPAEFLDWARRNSWPGNVRQLRNAVQRAIALREWLPHRWDAAVASGKEKAGLEIDLAVPFREAKQRVVDEFDRRYVTALLSALGGNVSAAARAAGVDRMSIYKALQRLGLTPDVGDREG